jgi:hypothetical protein
VRAGRARKVAGLLAGVVVVRMAFHALWLPAFEGPDEPHHLARLLDFARRPLGEAFRGDRVPADVVAAVRASPCPRADAGCPPYGSEAAAFNLLREPPAPGPADEIPNQEAKQPPLYYLVAGLLLRLAPGAPTPASALLSARLFSVGLVAAALFGPLRTLSRGRPPAFALAGLLALLLPGASEGLARCSNDAAVFLWASLVVAAVEKRSAGLPAGILLGCGLFLKLTALPVAAFGFLALLDEGRWAPALLGAAVSSLVVPVQALRGGAWGEMAHFGRLVEPVSATAVGLARTAYSFVKTIFWTGGWSLVRPPRALVAFYAILVVSALAAWRPRARPVHLPAHAVAVAVGAAGVAAYSLALRLTYGVWEGVPGWYFWGWSPWVAVAVSDLGTVSPSAARPLLWAGAVFALVANVVSLRVHGALFGW